VRAQLAELERRVQVLEQLVRHDGHRCRSATMVADDRDLLRAILASIGDGVLFSARELLEHAGLDPVLARALRGVTAKGLGKRLRRLEGSPSQICDGNTGCVIRAVGRDEHGRIWVLQVVGDLQPDPCGAGEDRRE